MQGDSIFQWLLSVDNTGETCSYSSFLPFSEEGDREKFQFSQFPNGLSSRPAGQGSEQTGLVEGISALAGGISLPFHPACPNPRSQGRYSFEVPPSDKRIEANSSKCQADM